MARDLTVTLEDRPGALADMGDALGRAGVNIDGVAGATGSGSSQIHILVEDADRHAPRYPKRASRRAPMSKS